jgi:trehalose 6-phosphate phosphatase
MAGSSTSTQLTRVGNLFVPTDAGSSRLKARPTVYGGRVHRVSRRIETADDLPRITSATALFLDFDGTLADLMPTPEDVRVPSGTLASLVAQQKALSGALAIVTGRAIDDLDRLLAPLQLTAAGMHGAEMRLSDDTRTPSDIVESRYIRPDTKSALRAAALALGPLVALHKGLRLETKSLALSLHYRGAPEHAALCWQAAVAATRDAQSLDVRPGKMVVEIVPRAAHKGTAIRHFMTLPPFAARMPIFAGDDAADEDAIAAVQALGGTGIRIVDDAHTPTCAAFSVASPDIIRAWIARV